MRSIEQVGQLLDEVLGLNGRLGKVAAETPLIGHVPEFDSMAVISIITLLEERTGIVFDDEDLTIDAFRTVGTLAALIDDKLAV